MIKKASLKFASQKICAKRKKILVSLVKLTFFFKERFVVKEKR